jgi:hypothetical protein
VDRGGGGAAEDGTAEPGEGADLVTNPVGRTGVTSLTIDLDCRDKNFEADVFKVDAAILVGRIDLKASAGEPNTFLEKRPGLKLKEYFLPPDCSI